MADQKDNSGAIFINDRKEKDTHPDRTGKAMIDGTEYYVSGWLKDGKRGKYLSLAFKRVDSAQAPKPQRQAAPVQADDFDDDVPF